LPSSCCTSAHFLRLTVKLPIARITGIATIAIAVGTSWVPAYLLLTGLLAPV
jgi:hypothetical protein